MNEEEIKLISKLQENAIKYKFLKRNNVIFDMNKYYDDYVLFELIQRLKQENQQLKEQLKDEENWRVKIAKENSSNVSECLKLIEQKKQYKSVLDEIRKYITEDLDEPDFEHCGEIYVEYEWFTGLLQILDKVKE